MRSQPDPTIAVLLSISQALSWHRVESLSQRDRKNDSTGICLYGGNYLAINTATRWSNTIHVDQIFLRYVVQTSRRIKPRSWPLPGISCRQSYGPSSVVSDTLRRNIWYKGTNVMSTHIMMLNLEMHSFPPRLPAPTTLAQHCTRIPTMGTPIQIYAGKSECWMAMRF